MRTFSLRQAAAPIVTPPSGEESDALYSPFVYPALDVSDAKQGALIGVGGAAIAGLSSLLPESIRPLGVVTGVLTVGLGVYRIYDSFLGDPRMDSFDIPAQSPKDLSRVLGEFVKPTEHGAAELSSFWRVFWGVPRTYEVQFKLENNSTSSLVVPIQILVTEHPTIGSERVSTANLAVNISPGESVTKIVYLPIATEMAGGISAVGKILLKGPMPTGKNDRILAVTQFTIN